MAIPIGMMKYVISGQLPSQEVFQTAFYNRGAVIGDATDAGAAAVIATPTAVAFLNAWKALMSTSTVITGFDMYFYNGGNTAAAHGHADILYTGTGAQVHPHQTSCVLTLRTAVATRSGRGRMYLVANGQPITASTGLFTSTAVDAAVDKLADWMGVLNDLGGSAVVVSQTHTSSADVTRVDADYVPDTQRRRANKLKSVRHSKLVT